MSQVECKDLLMQISNYIDGEIPPALLKELEDHIHGCENCRIVVDTTRKTISLFHHMASDQETPENAREHLYRTLNLEDYLTEGSRHG
jgi:anti-sigma factor RsiW